MELGQIFYLGRETDGRIRLDADQLVAHMCVAGAARSGKSNFCYQLLDQLMKKDVRFMVIEPAKGQYSQVFGGRGNISCYGTSVMQGERLHINPFAFHKSINVLEHLESICSIFFTVWPMYAAMTDLLKDAIIRAYQDCGWNMDEGYAEDEAPSFPSFDDVMVNISRVVDESDYSDEVKGNYRGALNKRLKSMTNGINRSIFCMGDISDDRLFGENTIIDISHVASSEVQALIMGMLVNRLAEYRRCENVGMDLPLRHVTLLEEAHNLLGTTSVGNSGEGSNIGEKSVELVTKAIAEMGTYGEGFIIVDQSPSALVPSAIANTSTKVIFSLTHRNDYLSMSAACSLNDAQTMSIPHLQQGACVISSRDWTEAILMKVDYFQPKNYKPFEPAQEVERLSLAKACATALQTITARTYGTPPPDESTMRCSMDRMISAPKCKDLCEVLQQALNGHMDPITYERRVVLLQTSLRTASWFTAPTEDLQAWDKNMRRELARRVQVDEDAQNMVISTLIQLADRSRSRILTMRWMAMHDCRIHKG